MVKYMMRKDKNRLKSWTYSTRQRSWQRDRRNDGKMHRNKRYV